MPDAVTHPTLHELIAFGLGKLPEPAVTAVAAHLESCAACRQAVAGVTAASFLDKVRAVGPDASSFPPGLAKPDNAPSSADRPASALNPCPDLPPELARHSKYLILRELGRGGMGVVYQARHKEMDRQVVIKVINRKLLARLDVLERFHREIRAAASLSHPNIVTAYDAERVGDAHMLVMEFVPGRSLDEVVKKHGPLPVANACHYVRQAALGLQHAHERGLVHRDIKPQNLMLTVKNQVKILDFGLAKVVCEEAKGTGLTAHDSYMGTPDYCAPEQSQDARSADTRADLYSLGCTLYYFLAGRPPFREDTVVNTILAHLHKAPTPLPELRAEVPAELWQVVARLLAKEPAQRYQKPLEVVQALGPFVKSGGKPESKSGSAPAAASPAKGTMVAADTSQIKKVLREVSGKAPRKEVPETMKEMPFAELVDSSALPKKARGARESRKQAPAAWWKRPGVLAVAISVSLTLILMAAIINNVKEICVKPGTGKVEVKKDGFTVYGEEVERDAGGRKSVPVRLVPAIIPSAVIPPKTGPNEVAKIDPKLRCSYMGRNGEWKIEANELVQTSGQADCQLVFGDFTWTDYDFIFEAKRVNDLDGIGLLFHVSNSGFGNFYASGYFNKKDMARWFERGKAGETARVQVVPGRLGIDDWFARGYAGVYAHRDHKMEMNRWYKLRVSLRGKHCQCFLDDKEIFDYNDNHNPQGAVGFWTWGTVVRFRNIRVSDPSGKVLFEDLPELPTRIDRWPPTDKPP